MISKATCGAYLTFRSAPPSCFFSFISSSLLYHLQTPQIASFLMTQQQRPPPPGGGTKSSTVVPVHYTRRARAVVPKLVVKKHSAADGAKVGGECGSWWCFFLRVFSRGVPRAADRPQKQTYRNLNISFIVSDFKARHCTIYE